MNNQRATVEESRHDVVYSSTFPWWGRIVCALIPHDLQAITDFWTPEEIREELQRTGGRITRWSKCARCGFEPASFSDSAPNLAPLAVILVGVLCLVAYGVSKICAILCAP